MKKILKVFSILMALAMIAGFTSCDDIFNFGFPENNNNFQQATNGDDKTPINHTFYLSLSQTQYKYYTDTTHFSFTDKEPHVVSSSLSNVSALFS